MDNYVRVLISTASTLDSLTFSTGEIAQLANIITYSNNDEKSTIVLLKKSMQLLILKIILMKQNR